MKVKNAARRLAQKIGLWGLIAAISVLLGCADNRVTSAPALSANSEIWIVADQRVPCVGVGPQQCLRIKKSPSASWTLFYGEIEGFDYQPGLEYTLAVSQHAADVLIADGPSTLWRLQRVIKTEPR